MTPTGPLRRLSGTEAACAWRHVLTGGQTQTATRLTVAAVFSPAYVERAVGQWARGFRALSLRIVEEDGSLWFHEVPGLDTDQFHQETYPAAPPLPAQAYGYGYGHDGAARAGTARSGDVLRTGGPLWRLEVGHDPAAAATHLLLTCHPALCDGPSTARLLRALLDTLLGPGPSGRRDPVHRQDPAPDADELTYRPPPPPNPEPHPEPHPHPHPQPGPRTPLAQATGPGTPGAVPAPGSAGAVVPGVSGTTAPVTLTARQTARLTAWCRRHRITTEQFFAAALADSCARAAGQEEVALLTAVSLRQRYAEQVRVPEVGCFVRLVPASVRAGDGGTLADRARAYGLALRVADAAWRPTRQDHARIRRAVEDETAFAGGGLGFRFAQEGCADTALGHHAALVTRYTTTPYTAATTSHAAGATPCTAAIAPEAAGISHPAAITPNAAAVPPYAAAATAFGTVHAPRPYGTRHGRAAYETAYDPSYKAEFGVSSGAAAQGTAPRQLGFLHLSRFRGALTLSLGMPNPAESTGPSAGAGVASGGLTAPRIAAELTARALDPVT
ncbi:hypothetical protein [Streptomyces sp. NPDC018036]|uniref:hypothetical protein n=1 Tax=Streptomyces sp. NPDC018036 TaxID=3365035 RepID=UPI0037AE1BAA